MTVDCDDQPTHRDICVGRRHVEQCRYRPCFVVYRLKQAPKLLKVPERYTGTVF